MTIADKLMFSKNALSNYAKKIGKLIDQEIANEESFYPDFRDLLKAYFKTDEFEIVVTPKTDSPDDKPDFIVYMDNIPIISVEAKNPNAPIDRWLKTESNNRLFEQVYRYRGRESGNIPVLVTDFLQIWIIDKESSNSMNSDHEVKSHFKIVDDTGSAWKTQAGAKSKLESGLNYLCEDLTMSITKISSMIPLLVKYAKKLKEKIIEVFKDTTNPMKTYLESIRTDILDSIFSSDKEKKSQEFADLIAQTLIYGGFIAWMRFCKDGNASQDFTFSKATSYLPYGTFTFQLFTDTSTKSSPDIQKNIISKIERIFQSSEFEKITENTETLMITFYSIFLWQYDSELAKDRGIVYTPHPIINFIVRGIDYFLKDVLEIPEGIISSEVNFLDPAAGTMGFPCEIVRLAREVFEKMYSAQPGRIKTYFDQWIHKIFLKNTNAFEILMAPYVLGHLRINMLITELGGTIDPAVDKTKLFLFNTLMDLQTTLKDFRNPAIGQEIVEALNIRNKKSILAVLSNPPYNISSQNKYDWILKKMEDYKENIQRAGTKKITNLQPLQDDYAKFIRFAQWKVKQNKSGIVAYITNNHYIDGLIFRGMRSSLRKDFDQIWIVDLHGNARKGIPFSAKEKGIKVDENVFDIKVGVAIVFLIRTEEHDDDNCSVYYVDKWGKKHEKFEFLLQSISDINFNIISERLDFEFCPDEFKLRKKYQKFVYFLDIFKEHISGIKTHHDSLVSDLDEDLLINKLETFFDKGNLAALNTVAKKISDWDPDDVRNKTNIFESKEKIVKWNYRGFDKRFICYHAPLIVRNRFHLMQYFIPPNTNNIALVLNRQSVGCKGDSSIIATDTVVDGKCCESAKGGYSYFFPFKISNSEEKNDNLNPKEANDSNINEDFKRSLQFNHDQDISDEQIFYYIYAVLYSPTYRKRYYLGLRNDFPRVPIPEKKDVFIEMGILGEKLVTFHLLNGNLLNTTSFSMNKSTDYRVYNVRRIDKDKFGIQIPDTYDPSTKKIYFKKRTKSQIETEENGEILDDITWIGGITQEMWDFEIGGRQQLKEWLYARRYSEEWKKNTISRPLSNEELEYFLLMCDAIKKTIKLLPKLDEIYLKIDP